MKTRILDLISIFSFICTLANAQPAKSDTVKQPPIYKLLLDGANRIDTLAVDTTTDKLHYINPAHFTSPWFNYLTRSGYPLLFNGFLFRQTNIDYFYPTWYLYPYIHNFNNNYYFHTRRQFTSLTFKNAGSTSDVEEYLQVLHTQNLTKRSNLGLLFDMNAAYSEYDRQKASVNAADIFYRYGGDVLKSYYRLYHNSLSFNETGGIIADSVVDYSSDQSYGFEARLKNAKSNLRRTGFFMSQEIVFGTKPDSDNDSIDNDSIVKKTNIASLTYSLNLEMNRRNYFEEQKETGFYTNFYKKGGISSDSIFLNKLSNRFTLRSPSLLKILPDLSVSITNKIFQAGFGALSDTLFKSDSVFLTKFSNKDNFDQTYFTADARQSFGLFDWIFSWDSYLIGYGAGDQRFYASTVFYAGKLKRTSLQLEAMSSFVTPSFMLLQSYNNHIYFNDPLKREINQKIGGKLMLGKDMFSLFGHYNLRNDFVYFDTMAIPKQLDVLHYFSFGIESKLTFWKFTTSNNILMQKVSDVSNAHLPELLLFNSTDFRHTFHFFTGGRLYTKLGFDVFYTSAYKAAAYMPATGIYYLQDDIITGNWPKVDAHLTLKVKTVSFFLKLSHINARYTTRQFSALHYPMMPMVFSYGINWLFYD